MRWFLIGTIGSRSMRALVAAAALGLSGLVAGSAAAQQRPAAPPGARVTDQWEDVLLLQAIRALRLTSSQLGEILPLAQAAAARLAQLSEQEKVALARLDRLAEENRAALLAGRPGKDQAEALAQREAMQQRRARTEEEIVDWVAPRLARMLTRDQVLRASLLTLGRDVPGVRSSPALYDPPAGFVLGDGSRDEWRDAALRQVLSRRYPSQVVSALSPLTVRFALDSGALVEGVRLKFKVLAAPADLGVERLNGTLSDHFVATFALSESEPVDEAQLQQARKEFDALQEAWNRSPAGLIAQANEPELASLLRHLVRRMFLSPRRVPVLEERLDTATPPGRDEQPEPCGTGVRP